MNKSKWHMLIAFAAGTFFGGYVLNIIGGIFGRA